MPSVQFFGIESIMQAAENLNCPAWGIFIDRGLFSKYEGDDIAASQELLRRNLEALQEGGTTAIYLLKFFESEKGQAVKINDRTVCNCGSFRFKLIEPEEREARMIGNSSQYGIIKQMNDEIAALKQQLSEKEEEQEAEDNSIGGLVMGLLKNPEQLGQIVNVGRALLGLPVQQLPAPPATIGALPAIYDNEANVERLSAAIDTLEKNDARLIDHLEKLAKMATDSPDQFKTLLSMLDLK